MARVMKFILQGKVLETIYHETAIKCFSDKIKAFLAEHSNEAVYVCMNKATAKRMYKYIRGFYNLQRRCDTTPYDSTLRKIIREFEVNSYGKSYKCIAYIAPTLWELDEAIKKTISHEGPFTYVNCHSFLNGYTTKPYLL